METVTVRCERVDGPGVLHRPPCEVAVHLSRVSTGDRRRREQAAARRGLPAEQCARPSFYRIDGVAMCPAHAGNAAVRILLGEVT